VGVVLTTVAKRPSGALQLEIGLCDHRYFPRRKGAFVATSMPKVKAVIEISPRQRIDDGARLTDSSLQRLGGTANLASSTHRAECPHCDIEDQNG
jgi:hypothetical protein